jgi:hypothetical protein
LKVYDQNKVATQEQEKDTKLDEVKTKLEDEIKVEDEPPSRPVVEEISSITFEEKSSSKPQAPLKSVLVPKFDW